MPYSIEIVLSFSLYWIKVTIFKLAAYRSSQHISRFQIYIHYATFVVSNYFLKKTDIIQIINPRIEFEDKFAREESNRYFNGMLRKSFASRVRIVMDEPKQLFCYRSQKVWSIPLGNWWQLERNRLEVVSFFLWGKFIINPIVI